MVISAMVAELPCMGTDQLDEISSASGRHLYSTWGCTRVTAERFLLPRWLLVGQVLVGVACSAPDGRSGAIATLALPGYRQVRDIPLPGRTTRFDYQSIDSSSGRLYIAHQVTVRWWSSHTQSAGRGGGSRPARGARRRDSAQPRPGACHGYRYQ